MKVLVVHNQYLHRGGEDTVREMELTLLRDRGHAVDTYLDTNERVASVGRIRSAVETVWSQSSYRALRERLRGGGYDVMHAHNTFPLISPAAYYAARAEGVPVVQTLHNYRLICPNAIFYRQGKVCEDCLGKAVPWPGVLHGCYRGSRAATAALTTMLGVHRLMRTWTELVDVYVALTDFERGKFVEAGFPDERIAVKPQTVVPDPGAGRHEGDYALFVGRVSQEKGIDTLLRAWEQLRRPVKLKVVGDGPLMPQVIEAAARNPSIEALGRRPKEEVARLMKDAQALVMPSVWYEGFPMVLAEAFATGLPVITSDLGSMQVIIDHGRTGLRCPPGDAGALAAAVDEACGDPERLRTMSQAARAEFETRYTEEHYYSQLLGIYGAAIERGAARARPRKAA